MCTSIDKAAYQMLHSSLFFCLPLVLIKYKLLLHSVQDSESQREILAHFVHSCIFPLSPDNLSKSEQIRNKLLMLYCKALFYRCLSM